MKQLFLMLILVFATAAAWALPSRADSGLHLVAESAEPCAAPCDRAAVVFIHGYTGARETWTNGQAYWPALLASDSDLKDRLDIYSVVYDSLLFSGPPIREVVADLEKELDALMVQKRYAKVIFICHSLGGIVARQYLLHVNSRYGHTALGRFRLVITLGTPMQGSSLSRLARWASSNEQLRVLGPIRTNDYLQLVIDTVRDFAAKHEAMGCPSLKVFAAYEELGVTPVGIVVDRQSATLDASEIKGFNRDHISLPKPVGTNDEVYAWAKRSMVDCLDGLAACPAAACPNQGIDFAD